MEHKILLIGFGRWGKIWYNTIINYKRDLIVGVVDPNGTGNFKLDIPHFIDIDDVDVEFTHAILAVPASLQLPLFEKLKKKIPAKNILVEKPVGLVDEKLDDAFPGFVFLHHPIHQYIKDNMKKDLGKIHDYRTIRASMGPTLRKDCSIIEDYLIHDIYMFIDLFTADVDAFIPPTKSVVIINKFKNYPISSILLTGNVWNCNIQMESSWWYPEKIRKTIIIGEKGSYIWDGDGLVYDDSYYKEINGKDKFNNEGYELVEGEKHQVRIETFLTPLTVQLINFLHDKTDYTKIINKTKKMMKQIYEVIEEE